MPINSEVLQRLLIDRGLGELSPDVTALLETYLDLDASCGEDVQAIDATLTSAREALKTGDQAETQSLPSASFLNDAGDIKPTSRTWGLIKYVAIAAMIVLAIRLGAGKPPADRPDDTSNRPTYVKLPNQSESKPSRFWSARRWQHVRSDSPFKNRQHIQWADPMRWPRRGDES